MHWFALIPMVLLCSAGAWLSYARHKEAWWAVWVFTGMSAVCGWLWGWCARRIPDENRMYWFSLVWDSAMLAVYYGLPPLFANVRLTKWGWLGAAMIGAGLIIVKTVGLRK